VEVETTVQTAAEETLQIPCPHQIPELILSEMESYLGKEEEDSIKHTRTLIQCIACLEDSHLAKFGTRIVSICTSVATRVLSTSPSLLIREFRS